MKKCLVLFLGVCLVAVLALAADRPPAPVAPGIPVRVPGSDVGRYQIVVTGQPHPMLMKFDTVTGDAWQYQEVSVDNKHLGQKFTASGWGAIPDDLGTEIQKAMNLGKPKP